MNDLINDSESGAKLPKIQVEPQLSNHFVNYKRIETATCCPMNKGLSTVGCSDELSNLILAVKSIEHVEEKLGLIVPVDTVV